METWEWIAIAAAAVVAVLVVVALAMALMRRRRRSHLKDRFGTEYDRAVTTSGQRDAEKRLAEVEQEHEDLQIRSLPNTTRDRYLDEWRQAESRFVSDPNDAVRAADRIVLRVLDERGYPTDGNLDNRTAHAPRRRGAREHGKRRALCLRQPGGRRAVALRPHARGHRGWS